MSDTDFRAPLPTTDDVAFFNEHGWWVSPVIFREEELTAIRNEQDAYYEGKRDRQITNGPAGWEKGRHGEDIVRKNDCSSLRNDLFMNTLIKNPYVGAAAGILMGAPGVRLWHDQLLLKPGKPASEHPSERPAVGWHTDQSYWKACTGPMITAWVPFTASSLPVRKALGPSPCSIVAIAGRP